MAREKNKVKGPSKAELRKKEQDKARAVKVKAKEKADKEAAKALQKAKDEVMKSYVKVVNRIDMHPTKAELLGEGHSKDKLRKLFGNMTLLRDETKAAYPEAFEHLVDSSDWTEENMIQLKKEIKGYKRFVVTSAVNGCQVHPGLLESVKLYCKENNAFLLVLPSNDPAHNLDNRYHWSFDGQFKGHIAFQELQLNSNLFISDIRIGAKQINPTTGLGRISQGAGSFIFGSPKQSLEFIPVDDNKYPHAMMSTGAMTVPNYKTARFLSERTAYIAEHDHVLGGLIIEIIDDDRFHFRQFQSDAQGGFADLGKFYKKDKVTSMRPDIVFGDWHAGETDPTAKQAWKELAKHVNARDGYFHDLFNGYSISHHDRKNKIIMAQKYADDLISLEEELALPGEELNDMSNYVEKMYIIRSNHDEFLTRYLQDGAHFNEPHNYRIGSMLSVLMIDGADPVKCGIESTTKLKDPKKIIWLDRDEGRKVAGIELGAHGDLGANGKRNPGMAGVERGYGNCVIGHTHTPAILRGVFRVGTTSLLRLSYTKGPSSWVHCSCLVYPNGSRQLINSFDGKWRLED